jgi:hypothetical protein
VKWHVSSRPYRSFLWFLVAILALAVVYVLSIGPATAWVRSAVSGAQSPKSAASTYDRRLYAYYRVYSPFFRIRIWTWYRVTHLFEDHFWRYEGLFARPRRLADGREVFSTIGLPVIPGETTCEYVHRLFGSPEHTPKPGTEVYALPRCRRVLVVLDPNEDDMVRVVLEAAIEHSAASYAELKIP